MRKLYILFLFVLLAAVTRSQKINDDARFSLRAGFGYNLPVATGVLATNFDYGAVDGIYGSWGKGILPTLDFSVHTCKGFRAVVGTGMLFGPEIKSSVAGSSSTGIFNRTTKSGIMIPALITLGGRYDILLWDDVACSHFIPYMGCGIGLAVGTTVKNSVYSIQGSENNTTTTEIKSTTTFKPALDIYGEAGIKYMFSERLAVFIDARLSSISLMPSKQKITSESVNGQDITSTLSISQKETDFVKKVPATTGGQGEPSKELAEKFPASGLAISCGIAWNFGLGGKVMLGGPGLGGGIPPGGPKGGGKGGTKEKVREAGAAAFAENCKSCPPPVIVLTTNNEDGKDFPPENTKISKTGPYGKTELLKAQLLSDHATCDSCAAVNQGCCCCRLDSLKIKLTFQITYNTDAINKGVWLNTKKGSDLYEHTCRGNTLPDHIQVNGKQVDLKPEEWKKVDPKSVEVHERQHCSDLTEVAKKFLDAESKKLTSFMCCTDNDKKRCKETVEKLCKSWKENLEAKLREKITEISDDEGADYGNGSLEKKAREKQSEDLNKRQE